MTHILVTGCPGAGKTTLARALAPRLGLTLVCKDDVKEAIFDALDGPVGDPAFSDRVGAASWEVLWALAGMFPRAMFEANFHPHNTGERARVRGLAGEVLEIHCACAPELARRRYAARAATSDRHRAHAVLALTDDHLAIYDRPLGVGEPLIVDTSGPVDIDAVAATARGRLGLQAAHMDTARRAVLMSGYPASGKTTLGYDLARALGFGFVSKDFILDIIFRAMEFQPGDFAASLRSGRAAWAVFWLMATHAREVVLDSNIKPVQPDERRQAAALRGVVIDVHCQCPRDLVRRRYSDRAAANPRPALRTHNITDERLSQYEGDLGRPQRVVVDTSTQFDVRAVVARVERAFADA
jgi:predicted kinase